MRSAARLIRCGLLAAVAFAVLPAAAQEFGVYLKCQGKVASSGKTKDSHVELALRRTSDGPVRERDQVIGHASHRGDDHHDLISRLFHALDPLRRMSNMPGGREAGTAVFLDD